MPRGRDDGRAGQRRERLARRREHGRAVAEVGAEREKGAPAAARRSPRRGPPRTRAAADGDGSPAARACARRPRGARARRTLPQPSAITVASRSSSWNSPPSTMPRTSRRRGRSRPCPRARRSRRRCTDSGSRRTSTSSVCPGALLVRHAAAPAQRRCPATEIVRLRCVMWPPRRAGGDAHAPGAPSRTASATRSASKLGRTSWTRNTCAPASSRSRSWRRCRSRARPARRRGWRRGSACATCPARRPAERGEAVEVAQQREVVLDRLAEADAGVEQDLVLAHAARRARRPCAPRGTAAPRRPRRRSAGRPASSWARPACA